MRVKFAGKIYELEKKHVEKSLRGVDPETGRRFFIEINGVKYPIKQAVSVAIGRPAMEIGTNTAYSTLRKLGFEVTDVAGAGGSK